jgi:hypothetical protein
VTRDTSRRHAHGSGRRRPCESYGCEPVVGRACPLCGSATILTRCSACGDPMAVCDCFDPAVAFDCFVSADGRCARCRSVDAGLSRGGAFMRRRGPSRGERGGGAR